MPEHVVQQSDRGEFGDSIGRRLHRTCQTQAGVPRTSGTSQKAGAFLSLGEELWFSADNGRTWRPRTD